MTDQKLKETVASVVNVMAKAKDKEAVYISGKVTGLDPEYCSRKFKEDANILVMLGFLPFNPTAHIKPDCAWQQAMRLCVAVLPLCNAIYMQPDWQKSKGAKLEKKLAEQLGLKVYYLLEDI